MANSKAPINARVYLVRHGDTNLNSGSAQQERFRAWSDPPLNDKGHESAQTAAHFLSDKQIGHIFASDLTRTMQTAQAVHSTTGAPITPMHGLRPWNLGEFTGQPVEPNEKEVQSYQDHPEKPIPGGESYNTFLARNNTTLHHIAMFSAQHQMPVAAVLHTRNINAVKGQLKGLSTIPIASMTSPGGIVRMDIRGGKVHLIDEAVPEGKPDEHKPGNFQE